jgi:hypothetical protein
MVASTFTQALFDKICDLIAEGMSLREVCKIKGMPNRRTFHDWHQRTPELQTQYDRACLEREDLYFEQIIAIADECRKGIKTTTKGSGKSKTVETVETDMTERAKIQIDARKWTLARMNRKKYGDHVTEELTGPNGGPLQVIKRVVLNQNPVEELPE